MPQENTPANPRATTARIKTSEEIEASLESSLGGCIHHWVEDETGTEPPFDTCIHCGEVRW